MNNVQISNCFLRLFLEGIEIIENKCTEQYFRRFTFVDYHLSECILHLLFEVLSVSFHMGSFERMH